MKTVLAALLCTLGAVACGESRPAENPTTTTSSTTETTATTPASGMTTTTPATMPSTTTPSTERSTTATTPGDLDTTRPRHDESMTGAPATSGTGAVVPSSDNPGAADKTKDATNTKINDRDRHGALTPMDQGGGNDRNITAAIRRSVVADKTLSFTAKNVKIITIGGKVTLRGPVKSDEEKSAIEAKAKAATGVTEVDNQLEVKK